jgi:hypothetical protein
MSSRLMRCARRRRGWAAGISRRSVSSPVWSVAAVFVPPRWVCRACTWSSCEGAGVCASAGVWSTCTEICRAPAAPAARTTRRPVLLRRGWRKSGSACADAGLFSLFSVFSLTASISPECPHASPWYLSSRRAKVQNKGSGGHRPQTRGSTPDLRDCAESFCTSMAHFRHRDRPRMLMHAVPQPAGRQDGPATARGNSSAAAGSAPRRPAPRKSRSTRCRPSRV